MNHRDIHNLISEYRVEATNIRGDHLTEDVRLAVEAMNRKYSAILALAKAGDLAAVNDQDLVIDISFAFQPVAEARDNAIKEERTKRRKV